MAYLDGTEEIVEPYLCKRMDDLEKAVGVAGPQLQGTAEMFRSGTRPTWKILKGCALLGMHVALPVAGCMLGGMVGLAVGGLMSAGLAVLGLTRQGMGEIESGFAHRSIFKDTDWKGQRYYTVAPDRTDAIDSKPIEVHPEMRKGSSDDARVDAVTRCARPATGC